MKNVLINLFIFVSLSACNKEVIEPCECLKEKMKAYKELRSNKDICLFETRFKDEFPHCFAEGNQDWFNIRNNCPEMEEEWNDRPNHSTISKLWCDQLIEEYKSN